MSADSQYGKEFLDKYLQVMGSAWRSESEEARLVADPTAYATAKGLPVTQGSVVKLDRTQPAGLFTGDQLVQDWTATPGVHILHVPAEELISEADLTEGELETVAGGVTVVIACYVGIATPRARLSGMPSTPIRGNMADSIVYHAGTYRTAIPEETWERVLPMLPRFGITRVADITGLDDIGLPVHVAYRPDGLSYAVSIGTGATQAQSRVSAVMESIEAWHAENLRVPVSARCAAVALDLDYDVRELNLADRSPLTANVVLDWVAGQGLLTGADTFAPADLIRLDLTSPAGWAQALFHVTSNGLATGNTVADAVLHGLVEVIERDSVVSYLARPPRDDGGTWTWPRAATRRPSARSRRCEPPTARYGSAISPAGSGFPATRRSCGRPMCPSRAAATAVTWIAASRSGGRWPKPPRRGWP